MSVFGAFDLPAGTFAFHETMETLPEAIVEIERVVVTDEAVTPYCWVTGVSLDAFEDAVAGDPSIGGCTRIDRHDEAGLYRIEWTDRLEPVVYAYRSIEGVVLEATGRDGTWEFRIRFDDREEAVAFREYLGDFDIEFTLRRLTRASTPETGEQYELTPKQREALVATWRGGYFDTPRESTLQEIATDIGISQQSLSQRLRRGFHSLIGNTLVVTAPAGE